MLKLSLVVILFAGQGFALECAGSCDKVSCLSDFLPAKCPKNSQYNATGGSPCGCCPVCVQRVGQDGKCEESGEDLHGDFEPETSQRKEALPSPFKSVQKLGNQILGSPPVVLPGTKCQAGFICEASTGVCKSGTSSNIITPRPTNCFDWLATNRPVSCDTDGTYLPVQCNGKLQTTRCYCVDKKNKRIFGAGAYEEKDNMNCACSRKIAELQESGRKDVTLHCDSKGNYEELQCDDGICWCVDPLTTEVYSQVVIEKFVKMLPCYNANKFGVQYLRRCDSVNYAVAKLEELMYKRGVGATLSKQSCDWDGGYGPVQCKNAVCFCSKKDRSIIDPFQGTIAQKSDMTCLCARDQIILNNQGPLCDEGGLGNYKKDQSDYCVDENGDAIPKKVTNCVPPKCPAHPVPYSVWLYNSCG